MKNTMRLTLTLDVRITKDETGKNKFSELQILELFEQGAINIIPSEIAGRTLIIRKEDGAVIGDLITRK